MKRRSIRFSWLFVWLTLSAAVGVQAVGAAGDMGRFLKETSQLCEHPHRQAGSPEGRQAGDFLRAALDSLPGQVFEQHFTFPGEVVHVCRLVTEQGSIPLLPLAANGLQPAVTPAEGVSGRLIYLGGKYRGNPSAALDGKPLGDWLAIADFDQTDALETAFSFGARAIIFMGTPDMDRSVLVDKETFLSANLPRFYLSGHTETAAQLLASPRGTLTSRVEWQLRTGRNLVLLMPGTAPDFGAGRAEAVVLSAPYDSRGIVPLNAPDQERAANCAALLEIARALAQHPPRRDVVIAFFDAHANFLEGGRQFYAAFREAIPEGLEDPWPVRKEYIRDEQAFIHSQLEYLGLPDPITAEHPVSEQTVKRLRDDAQERYDLYQEQISRLRLAIHRHEVENSDATKQSLAELLAARGSWQRVRECLRDRESAEGDTRLRLETLLDEVRGDLKLRLDELHRLSAYTDESAELGSALAARAIVLHASLRFTADGAGWMFSPHAVTRRRFFAQLMDRMEKTLSGASRTGCGFVWSSRALWERAQKWIPRKDEPVFSPWESYEEADLAAAFELPGMTLLTDQDRAPHMYMPDVDVPDAALATIHEQAMGALPFLSAVANGEWASLPRWELRRKRFVLERYRWEADHAVGHAVKRYAFGQTQAQTLEPCVVVSVMDRSDADRPFALRRQYRTYTDRNGIFPLMPIYPTVDDTRAFHNILIESAGFNEDGLITRISALRAQGGAASVQTGWDKAAFFRPRVVGGHYNIVPTFEGSGMLLIGSSLPFRDSPSPLGFNILNGLSNAQYDRMHFRFDERHGVGVCFVGNPMGVKVVYRDTHEPDNVALYLNPTVGNVNGVGYGPGSPGDALPQHTVLSLRGMATGDVEQLNEQRLSALRERNIVLNMLEYLHSRATRFLEEAEQSLSAKAYSLSRQSSALALSFGRRVYQPVIATTNDMVVAATLLLLLALPFALAVQRLILPSYSVYRQMLNFALVFGLTYLVLYLVHPAFSFSASPSIIILAFALMIMSGMVIWILSGKFRYEIMKMQGLASAAHAFQRRGVGNVGVAVSLAVSTMRRRPARTVLTITTVVMLTFTVTSFVSFSGERGVNTFYRGAGDEVRRLLIHQPAWKTLPTGLLKDMREFVGDKAIVQGRYWRVRELSLEASEDLSIRLLNGESRTAASAIMSLDAEEMVRIPGFGAVAGECDSAMQTAFRDGRGVLISPNLAEALEAKTGDLIRVEGLPVKVLGVFNTDALYGLHQIDGSPLLPVNFRMTQMASGEYEYKGSASSGDPQAELEQLFGALEPEAMEPISPETLIIAPPALAVRMGCALKAVVIYPAEEEDIDTLSQDLAIMINGPVFVNRGGERQQKVYGEKYGVGGLNAVAVPLLLGGLIVFCTMLGSVIDREREIRTFSALGLPPRAIASLFFFEAGVYAVVGGFGGYLLSQVVTAVMEQLARFGWFTAPEMNYSSSSAINTILVVMATVMVSTIYPAISAARKATAESRGTWRVPAPDGDQCRFEFPFTISQYDVDGVLCFIREYFNTHADRTVGSFAADEVELFTTPGDEHSGLRAVVWLQPFDQGISQSFEVVSRASSIPELCAIQITQVRRSGQAAAWRRSYAVFLSHLREQFLLWRTLDDDSREKYLQEAERFGVDGVTHG